MSAVLNGMGNGAMVLGLPAMAWRALQGSKDHVKNEKAVICFSVAGALIGACFGYAEARRVQEYHQKFVDEITKLRTEVDNHTITLQGRVSPENTLAHDPSQPQAASR